MRMNSLYIVEHVILGGNVEQEAFAESWNAQHLVISRYTSLETSSRIISSERR